MELRCPQCDAPVAHADQKYCLNCGIELPGAEPSRAAPSGPTTRSADVTAVPSATGKIESDLVTPGTAEPAPVLSIELPTGDQYIKQINSPQVRLGKGPHNDIVISDPSVSSVHALIARADNTYIISDLGSRNGTFVNQERVTEPRPLRAGDVINLGRSRLTFQSASAGDTVALPPIDIDPPVLVGITSAGDRIERLIDRSEITIGKAPHNQIVLADATVSSAHAVILSKSGEYSIVDLGSRNGTYVDGERLGGEARKLKHGDTIRLGGTMLTFRYPARAAESTTALPRDLAGAISKQDSISVEPSGPAGPLAGPVAGTDVAAAVVEAPAVQSGQAATESAQVDKDAGKKDLTKKADKNKKKKKKEKDERLRAAYIGAFGRVLAAVLSVILTVGIAFYIREGGLPGKTEVTAGRKGKAKLKLGDIAQGSPISGGNFEASGVVQVPGTNGVLFVDDNRPSQVLWMEVDDSGHQVGEAKPVELGAEVEDPEGITYGGSYFYIAGSQSNPKGGANNALARFSFDSTTLALRGRADIIPDLRSLMFQQVPDLKSVSQTEKGALDIEGITWDPNQERLLLGLRAPVLDGQALVVPLKLRDPLGAFVTDNLEFGTVLRLPLGGLGIRDIQYDSRLKAFLIIAGESAHHDKKVFKLWEWDGNPVRSQDESSLREEKALDEKIKPEGVARVVIGDHDYLLVVGDAGGYYKIDYSKMD